MFSEPENSMFPQLTASHRLRSGEMVEGDMRFQVPCAMGTLGARPGRSQEAPQLSR